jgi:hypothetical protein
MDAEEGGKTVDTETQVAPETRDRDRSSFGAALMVATGDRPLCGLASGLGGRGQRGDRASRSCCCNFIAAAVIMSRGEQVGYRPPSVRLRSGGYIVRLVVILVALLLLRQVSWIDMQGARLRTRRHALSGCCSGRRSTSASRSPHR